MGQIRNPVKPLAEVVVLPGIDGAVKIAACFLPNPDQLSDGKHRRAALALDGSKSMRTMFGAGIPFCWGPHPNYVQLAARKIGGILCDWTSDEKVSMLYWALGPGGTNIKVIGEFDKTTCQSADMAGPGDGNWGNATRVLPRQLSCAAIGFMLVPSPEKSRVVTYTRGRRHI